jgi:hypothetical protein
MISGARVGSKRPTRSCGSARGEDLKRSSVRDAEARGRRAFFGGTEVCKERCREARAAGWTGELARNLIYAARSMGKNRGFTAMAVLSLALGIGANAAKAPIRAPERLSYPKFQKRRDNFDVSKTCLAGSRTRSNWSWTIARNLSRASSRQAIISTLS